jgi:hypothetical protein
VEGVVAAACAGTVVSSIGSVESCFVGGRALARPFPDGRGGSGQRAGLSLMDGRALARLEVHV